MTNKERYRKLCATEQTIPLFSQDWWLDEVCGCKYWDVLLVLKGDNIVASMPVYIPHKGIISMPCYTQTMGPWFSKQFEPDNYSKKLNHRQVCCKEFTEKLEQYPHFLQNFHSDITDWLPFYWAGYKQTTRYSYLLKNIGDKDQLWKNLSSNICRNIINARDKEGITVRKGIPTEDFMRINAQSYERQKLSVKGDPRLLRKLIARCRERNQGDLWGGYDDKGRLHAAVFIVWHPGCAYYLAGGGDPEFRSSGAYSLVLWEAIHFVSDKTDTFDFEGSMLAGVEHYFRKFGTMQTPYFTITRGNISLLYKAWLKLAKVVTKQYDTRDDHNKV